MSSHAVLCCSDMGATSCASERHDGCLIMTVCPHLRLPVLYACCSSAPGIGKTVSRRIPHSLPS